MGSVVTLRDANKVSIKDRKAPSEKGKGKYQLLVGKFIYLTLTRPNINYVVNVMHASMDVHLAFGENFLLSKKNPRKSFLYTKQADINMKAYADAQTQLH